MRNICKCCILKIANSKFNFHKIYMSMFTQKIKKETYNINLKSNSNNNSQNEKIENDINQSNIFKIPLYEIPNHFNIEYFLKLKKKTSLLLNNLQTFTQFIRIKCFGKNDYLKFFIFQNDVISKDFQNLIYEYGKMNNYIENLKKHVEEINDFKIYLNVFEVALKDNNEYIEKLKEYYKEYENYYKQFANLNQNLYTYFCSSKK